MHGCWGFGAAGAGAIGALAAGAVGIGAQPGGQLAGFAAAAAGLDPKEPILFSAFFFSLALNLIKFLIFLVWIKKVCKNHLF